MGQRVGGGAIGTSSCHHFGGNQVSVVFDVRNCFIPRSGKNLFVVVLCHTFQRKTEKIGSVVGH